MIGTTEIVIILVAVAILLFGGKKITEFTRSLGKAVGEFQKGRIEAEMEIEELKKSSRRGRKRKARGRKGAKR